MPVLTIILVALTIFIAVAAALIAWRLRRAQRRDVHMHGYGPPIVVFPPASSNTITPAVRRRAPETPSAPEPIAERAPSVTREAEPAALSHEADSAGARMEEVERRLREDVERPRRVDFDGHQPEPERRPIRRRGRDSGSLTPHDLPDVASAAGRETDGSLALATSASQPAPPPIQVLAPPGGTLQMLPGRLVIAEGEESGRELRFVRLGANPQRVTLGRSPGRPYEHVQLRAQTVSRLHAQLQYDEGRWYVENLSRTNPLVLNGRALAAGAAPHPLAEGDVMEMGEVLLRFHER